ncbi:hypothetical protein [Synechococcus sp. PCC 7336]|uniref:hypothetical protein n=1 Tax=Synechococcus sp. PCC 7336 TaxID=195250 RepID=UPI00034D0415|nr:hypothetical protein [Synechococcus sp. PCC 7336]
MQGTAKDVARRLIDRLPEQATLDDIMYELYIRQKIEAGLEAAEEGRTLSHEQVKQRLLNREN